MLRAGMPEDASACGTICFEAFKSISEKHNFPPDFPAVGAGTVVKIGWFGGYGRYLLADRLRQRTVKGSALARTTVGAALLSLSAILAGVALATGQLAEEAAAPLMLALMGGAALVSNLFTLPSWARERAQQMEHIALRAQEMLSREPAEDVSDA